MDDYIRRRGYSAPKHDEVFDEIFEEFDGVEPVDVGKTEYDEEQVDESDPATAAIEQFKFDELSEDDDDFSLGRIRAKAYHSEEIDFEDNEGAEFGDNASSLSGKAQKYDDLNQEMKKDGIKRRYVLGEPDAPDIAHVYEDGIGKYYYEINARVRPSDITKVLDDVESRFELSEDGRVYGTVMLLAKAFPWQTIDVSSEDAVNQFLERALITEVEDLESEDVFSVDQVDAVKELLLNR